MRPTLKLLLNILVLEIGAFVRHDGDHTDLSNVLMLIFVVDKSVVGGVRVMCGLPHGESSAAKHSRRESRARQAGVQASALVKTLLFLHSAFCNQGSQSSTYHSSYQSHETEMASSRIFIKGLPPSITEADFKKHFSSGGREVTDARLFANRRIGYVGYKTPEDAQSAVKYFNKTFVRMSRIGVEVARPIGESNPGRPGARAPTAPKENHELSSTAPKVQNDGNAEPPAEEDPKLKEYLEVMKPKSKKRTWENDDALVTGKDDSTPVDHQTTVDAGTASDDEYEEVPRKNKRAKVDTPSDEQAQVEAMPSDVAEPSTNHMEENAQDKASGNAPLSDADWARSRTSRLLGLLDDEEEDEEASRPKPRAASVSSSDIEDAAPSKIEPTRTPAAATAPVSAPVDSTQPATEVEPTGVRASMRLFVRNLPYGVQEDALQSEFAPYGNLEEVRSVILSSPFLFKMST